MLDYFGIKMFGSIAAAYTTLIIYLVYFLIHYYLSVKIHGSHIFSISRLMIYAVILVIMAAISLVLRYFVVIRWGILIIVCFVGVFWADREFKIFSFIGKKIK